MLKEYDGNFDKSLSCSMWYGPERPKFLGPIEAAYPSYLEGEAPADYGFDILKLGKSTESFDRCLV